MHPGHSGTDQACPRVKREANKMSFLGVEKTSPSCFFRCFRKGFPEPSNPHEHDKLRSHNQAALQFRKQRRNKRLLPLQRWLASEW